MNLNEITREIQRLEQSETNYANCEKLAYLYTVRNGLTDRESEPKQTYSYVSGASEFLNVSHSKEYSKVLDVLDEHFECIRILYPTEYNVIMKRLRSL